MPPAPDAMGCVFLADARDETLHGGKAVQLGAALRAGLPVPRGLALPWTFVERLDDDASAARELGEALGSAGLDLVAVRSSAVGEDSATASFAGQHLTRLAVRGMDDVLRGVRDVRASGRAAGALAYRAQLGIADPPREIGRASCR